MNTISISGTEYSVKGGEWSGGDDSQFVGLLNELTPGLDTGIETVSAGNHDTGIALAMAKQMEGEVVSLDPPMESDPDKVY